MMTYTKIRAGEVRQYGDYLLNTAEEEGKYRARWGDYYLGKEGQEPERRGQWHEIGETVLGLNGKAVDRETLSAIWRNHDPVSGDPLVAAGANGDHVAAHDLTWSAPKDFSILWAVAPEAERARLEQAWETSVRRTLDHLQREIPLIRQRHGGSPLPEPAVGILASEFRHHTSRLTAEAAKAGGGPDPQIHSHVTLANVARRQDGKLAAVASHPLTVHQHEIGALVRANLAHELRELGYEIVRRDTAWGIAGISDRKRDWFSKREAEVVTAERAWVLDHGRPPSAEEKRNIVVLSRGQKDVGAAGDFERWRREEAELDRSVKSDRERGRSVAALVEQARERRALGRMGAEVPALTMGFDRARTSEEAAQRIIEELTTPVVTRTGAVGPDRLTAEDAVFDEVRLRKEIAREMQYHQTTSDSFGAIRDTVHKAAELQRIDDPSDALRAHWTTQRQLATERFVLDALRQRSRTGGHKIPDKVIQAAMAASRVPLDDEQRAAIAAMTDHRGLHLLSAEAGTGKGDAVAAVVADAYRRAGYRVVAVAVSGERSVKFGQQIKADRACSIDSLTQPGSTIGPRDLVIVDEAGQVDTVGRWDRLLRHVGSAKVLPIGDERQLSAVSAGGIFEEAQKRVPTVKLTRVYRNRDENVVAVWRMIREGRGREAAKTMLDLRMLDFAEDRRQLRDRLVDHWENLRRRGEFALLTDTSNREVDLVNAMIQARRRSRYELGTDGVLVRFQDPGKRDYVREETLYRGDLVKATETVWLDEQRRVIRNGESGEVVGVRDGAVLVRFGERASWIGGEELNKLRLAYMRHQQSGQGLTVEHVGGLLGGRSTTLEGGYVQASRARETALLLADLDSLGIPTEREVRPATKTEDAVVEPLTLEQRRQLALEVIGERLATSEAKETAVAALAREAAREQAHAQWAEQEGRVELETVPQASAHAPATERQRHYAEGLGIDIPEGATWVEASALLDAARSERIGGFAADRLAERGVDEEEIAAVLAQTENTLAEHFEAEAEARDAQNAELVTDDEDKLRRDELAAELRSKLEDALVTYWNRDAEAERWSDPALAEMSRENARNGLEWALRSYEYVDPEAVERVRRQEHLDAPAAAQAPAEREEKAPEIDREAEVADAVRQLEQDWEDADREDRERAEQAREEQERDDRQPEVGVEPDEPRQVLDDTPRAEPVREEEQQQPVDEQPEERGTSEAGMAPQMEVEPAPEQAAEQSQAPAPEVTAESEPEVE